MRFASIFLSNYIGIYNGMGLTEIHIDMTLCRHRILTIRGDNGGGKSTLMKALSLFPDPNDSFIPGLPARKEIVLIDNQTAYKLVFVHGVKTNGERETTKAYITKTFGDSIVELNENGNVTSYKDILFSELGLDANFAALSQLSNDDRGLADKKPAERKRFVNSIISSLDTYNNIYKTLTKRSSNYKSMINAIVAKLSVLGDEATLKSSLEDLEGKINALQDKKDAAVASLAKEQSRIDLLDPDGSIQLTNNKLVSEIGLADNSIVRLQESINATITVNGIDGSDIDRAYKQVVDRKHSLIIQNQISRNELESLLRQKEAEAEELNAKIQKLSSLQSGYSLETIMDKIAVYQAELDAIEEELRVIGLANVASISKEEYILALETLKDLDEYISAFKSATSYEYLDSIVRYYIEYGKIIDRVDIRTISDQIDQLKDSYNDLIEQKVYVESKAGLIDRLSLRPSSCTDDSCEFIKEAIEFSKTFSQDKIASIYLQIESLRSEIDTAYKKLEDANEFNNAVNQFAMIAREVKKNAGILAKLPNGEMFGGDSSLFFERILSGYSFEYIKVLYGYINLANQFDIYKQTAKVLDEYKAELKVYESKADIIDSISEDIDRINAALSSIASKIDPMNADILAREKDIARLQELETVFDSIFAKRNEIIEISKAREQNNSLLVANQKKMTDISISLERCSALNEEIAKLSGSLVPLMKERDKLVHSVQMMDDYQKERAELEANYEYIETIKYYSSPTTGIQLVFMELYMGKIIALANELLGLLFGGSYVIQPFVINESEFRIPCLGSGYINDDISSMSSSQIGMISMILSFALLHHSSTKYNIIKLDEIDGPLDYNNRTLFVDVLNRIMDIMGTEQCIMISHNTEFQVEDSDVILLKHDEDNIDYRRGNIIWSY